MARRLQERQLYPDGTPVTEWYDCLPPYGWELPGWGTTERDWRSFVMNLNKSMKLRGENLRFRSVEDDDEA